MDIHDAATTRPGLLRSAAATTACLAATAGLTASARASALGPLRIDTGVLLAVCAVGAAAAAILALGSGLLAVVAAARLVGRTLDRVERAAARLTPTLLRRAVAVTVGAGLGLGATASTATAEEIDLGWQVTAVPAESAVPTETPSTDHPSTEVPTSTATVAGVTPPADDAALTDDAAPVASDDGTAASTTTTDGAAPDDAPAHPGSAAAPEQVVVVPGDTLWGIAAAHLPPTSGDAEIAAAWPRWYEANRGVVGPDPGLIHPGQVLTRPEDSR